MNIVLSADESYARYGAVVMASVIANAVDPGRLRFFMLTPSMSEKTKSSLRSSVRGTGADLDIIDIDTQALKGLKAGRFGTAALLRLLMHCYLPDDCKRVIYLDCDVLVRSDLSDLWTLQLKGYPAAAAMDLCNPNTSRGRTSPEDYFNSGVMVIDLAEWRRQRVGERALSCLEQEGDDFRYPDQDALNQVLEGNWYRLSPDWNFQPTAYAAVEKRYAHLVPYLPAIEDAISHPRIVHFIGAVKPWHATCTHPFQQDFIDYSLHTPWPIDSKTLMSSLPWLKRIRMVLKKTKIRRRRRLTRF